MSAYQDMLKNKYNKFSNSEDYNLESPAAPAAPEVEEEAPAAPEKPSLQKGKEAAMQTAAKGGGAMDIIQQGLMASGHPAGMAAGLGLAAASSIVEGRNQRAQDKYKAEVDKINKRQEAITKMAMIGQGLRA